MSEIETKKQTMENGATELYVPKNILLTGGAGKNVSSGKSATAAKSLQDD